MVSKGESFDQEIPTRWKKHLSWKPRQTWDETRRWEMRGWAVWRRYYDSVNCDALFSRLYTLMHIKTQTDTQSFFLLIYVYCTASTGGSDAFSMLMPRQHRSSYISTVWCSLSSHYVSMCVHMTVHVFTGLLSISVCGGEHPLTLSCAQRADSAWYMNLGSGEEKVKKKGTSA